MNTPPLLRVGAAARRLAADARTLAAGVIGVLVLVLLLLQWTGPDVALARTLRNLPAAVQAVIIESPDGGVGQAILMAALRLPLVPLPKDVQPLATLVVVTEEGESTVALVRRSAVLPPDRSTVALGGLMAVGEVEVLRHVTSGAQAPTTVRSDLLRVLRDAPHGAERMLARTAWVSDHVPALGLSADASGIVALWVERTPHQVRLTGRAVPAARPAELQQERSGARPPARGSGRPVRLRERPPGTLLVIEGVPASSVLPSELPPVLEAVRAESGVGTELSELVRALGDEPLMVVLRARPDGSLDVVVALPQSGSGPEAVAAAVDALLAKRLALVSVVTDTVRVNGQRIRHRKPVARASDLPRETLPDGWDVRVAPHAGWGTDLVRAQNGDVVLLGTSREAVLDLRSAVTRETARPSSPTALRVFADGDLLRRQPVVALALRNLPAAARGWAETLGTVRLDVGWSLDALTFTARADL